VKVCSPSPTTEVNPYGGVEGEDNVPWIDVDERKGALALDLEEVGVDGGDRGREGGYADHERVR
jgi:hypothetical protein